MAATCVNRLTHIRSATYSSGMISEFHELSDKIDRLAEMALALRRENAQLRRSNAALVTENAAYAKRLSEAHRRVEALLGKIPALDQAAVAATDDKEAQ
jgi:cell division protein ZapB